MSSTDLIMGSAGSTAAVVPDANFENVSLLLSGDGTNGAQNNTFVATNYAASTALGGYSGYFNGSSSYLNSTTSAGFDFGTGDFTVEAFINVSAFITNSGQSNVDDWIVASYDGTSTFPWVFRIGDADNAGNNKRLTFAYNTFGTIVTSNTDLVIGTWTHVAVVRSGSTVSIFQNGTRVATASISANLTASGAGKAFIGGTEDYPRYFNGNISNVRVVKGTDVYGASNTTITVPTTALTAVSGTQLLTCQSATFVDNSSNNFTITVNGSATVATATNSGMTITRNGNTTQGSFSPYGTGWSNYFGGSGNYMYPPTNSAFNVGNSGTPFTFECWVFPVASGNFFAVGSPVAYGNGIACQWDGTYFRFSQGDGAYPPGSNYSLQSSSTYPANQWYHFAIVRNSSNVLTMYINGVAQASGTNTSGVASSTQAVINGVYDNGGLGNNGGTYYISNLRFVSGTAVYTSAFTPRTTPLTAISGTVLLTCQSNRFKDNSSNNYSFTIAGSPSVQRFSPFNPTAPYDTATIGGSMYMAESVANYITAPSVTIAGDFTMECWVYPQNISTSYSFQAFTVGNPNASSGFEVYGLTASPMSFAWYTNGSRTGTTFPSTVLFNTWTHIAVVRSGSTITFYANGVVLGTQSNSNTFSGTLSIGSAMPTFNDSASEYVSNFRFVNGTAVYTSAFTPPTAPVTAITNTALLCNFTNAGIPDLAMQNDLQTVGNAQVSTSVKKYGTGSLAFDGTGDALYIPLRPSNDLGSSDFTIEFWINPAVISNQYIYCTENGTYYSASCILRPTGKMNIQLSSNGTSVALNLEGTTTLTAGSWYHVAYVRLGTTIKIYVNGVLDATGTFSGAIYNTGSPFTIGARAGYPNDYGSISSYSNSYIDDFRITKGLARYTANFTPPSQALPNQ